MSIATYRGIAYDTAKPKEEYKAWWNKIHHNASLHLTYRGQDYRPAQGAIQNDSPWQ
ncbi:MAG: hypothetical protein ACO4CS_03845 [bacterium]|jgi:hypothetical protein